MGAWAVYGTLVLDAVSTLSVSHYELRDVNAFLSWPLWHYYPLLMIFRYKVLLVVGGQKHSEK